MSEKDMRVRRIEHGTVIDHIKGGQALNVLHILGISGSTKAVVSVAMNVQSDVLGTKDIVKVEDRELKQEEVDRISLIAPGATINIIRDFKVIEKHIVDLPEIIDGVVKCDNPNCISNSKEPVTSKFTVNKEPVELRCIYCDHMISEEIAEHLI
ncbi:MAG: aspartate carbamoyltransferase regulatory subunit [Candidatus Methanoperedens sp.]|jgi:aspartate carbamoyltransferase regulatory subunit|nr:aspartate carbamoyltransferase regulatory subunit [Candidatus Methanoperedens sp.]PKL53462.1 MAG: aspartate carbamoyltransferase regulatory subunit [Candidatus Methanoperedenaceae archaeon HGW-Methanoperedenaceae-1]